MTYTKRFLIAAIVTMMAMATLPAHADLAKDQASAHGVTQYLTIKYNVKSCQGYTAYDMEMISRRWYRSSTARRVPTAISNYGVGGFKCDLTRYTNHRNSELSPCFGCDGFTTYWTPDYVAFPNYPFVFAPQGTVDSMGANLKGTVKNASGGLLGYICTRVALYGSTNC